MSKQQIAVLSTSQLYPPRPPADIESLITGLPTGLKDAGGVAELGRAVTAKERTALEDREATLVKWMDTGLVAHRVKAISDMLMVCGGRPATVEEAVNIAQQYQAVIRDIPIFALYRACMMFSNGTVKADDLGQKTFDLSFPPTAPQVGIIARKLAQPLRTELAQIRKVLAGKARDNRPILSPEAARQQVQAIHDHFHAGTAAFLEEQARKRLELEKRVAGTHRDANERLRIAEYRAAGVDPPAGSTTSLAMLLKNGWRIEQHPQEGKILVRPG
jgi:hypothetical protein